MQPAHLSAVSKLPPLLMIGIHFHDTPAIGLCIYNGFPAPLPDCKLNLYKIHNLG